MISEDVKEELDRHPFVPLRLYLSSGQKIDIKYPGTAWVRRNTMLIVHPLAPGTAAIGNYDVVALPLIERMEQINGSTPRTRRAPRRRGQS
ncbi:MAG TPA: hypothetical protein VGR35_22990 [Tepidisphaeraceae bacterium]|nr:hypothetical protein [Tepidisphaeraceae bacterium]